MSVLSSANRPERKHDLTPSSLASRSGPVHGSPMLERWLLELETREPFHMISAVPVQVQDSEHNFSKRIQNEQRTQAFFHIVPRGFHRKNFKERTQGDSQKYWHGEYGRGRIASQVSHNDSTVTQVGSVSEGFSFSMGTDIEQEGSDMKQEEPDLEQDQADFREHRENAKSTYHPWITAAWYWLLTVLNPPPFGAHRITYTCGCGELCYIDVEELVPGGAEELEQDIRREASLVRCRNPNGGTLSSNNIQTPAPAHLNTSTLPHNGGQGTPIQGLPTLGGQSQTTNSANTTAQAPASNMATTGEKYLLLCVNTKRGLAKLVNVDVSIHTNDQFMFQEISNEYKTARQGHDWNITRSLPSTNSIPRSVLTLISVLPFPNVGLPRWVAGALQDCRLFIPRKVEFIKFELMPVHLEIHAGNFEKPEIPTVDEVLVKKTYEYEPTTLKARILNVPIHELLKPGQHLGRYWWKRFPKKLDSPLTYVENLDCYGWGILINEGWNIHFVFVLCFLAMVMFGVFVILYSVFTNDASTGAGIGSFAMAILTLYYTLEYNQWKEQ